MRGRPRKTDPEALGRRIVTVLIRAARLYPSQEWLAPEDLPDARCAFKTRQGLMAATRLGQYEVEVGLNWLLKHRYIRRLERGARGEWLLAKKAAILFSAVVATPPEEELALPQKIRARDQVGNPRGCSPKPKLPRGADKASLRESKQESKSKAAFASASTLDSNSPGETSSAPPGPPPTRDDFADYMATLRPLDADRRVYLRSGLSREYPVLWQHRGGLVIQTDQGPYAIFFASTRRDYRDELSGVPAWYGEVRVRFPTARQVLVVDHPTMAKRVGNCEVWSLGLAVDVAWYLRAFTPADVERYPLPALCCYLLACGAPGDPLANIPGSDPEDTDVVAVAEDILERWREWDSEDLPRQDIFSLWHRHRLLTDAEMEMFA